MDEASDVVRARLRGLLERLDADDRGAVLAGARRPSRAAFRRTTRRDRSAAASKASSISQSAGAGGASGEAPSGRIPSRMTPR